MFVARILHAQHVGDRPPVTLFTNFAGNVFFRFDAYDKATRRNRLI